MSYSETEMSSLGLRNEGWGICGFTSSLYAMYVANPASRPFLINAPQAWSVIWEIKDYLEELQGKGEMALIKSIEAFTQSFNGFASFTVANYLSYVMKRWNKCATPTSGDMNAAIQQDSKFSIAMPPDAVVDYLKRMWKRQATAQTTTVIGDGIVGVCDPKDTNMKLYGGLRHYVYKKGGTIYSWGETFTSIQDVNTKKSRNYHVCCMIPV